MKLNKLLATNILILLPVLSWGQLASSMAPPEPAGEYMFPIRTGNQNYLSGTMGELRSNHFHAGIDIKTQGVLGLEVYASAEGHVSRIKVATGGYGNALYILHPNGTTTVYAHLQKFNNALADHIRKAQYQQKSFEIELFPEKETFPVKKGEVIGYSGNSGSSAGPHLHFEIRDGQQRPLNPLQYKFPEIRDNIAPAVRKIALRTLDKNSRINGQYGRFEFNVLKSGNTYKIPVPLTAYGKIGIELLAHDKLNGANNRNGVPCLELNINGEQVFQQNLERFRFSETRSILIHTDYETAQEKGQRFVKMYVDDGNTLPFYQTNDFKGIAKIDPDSAYQVQISLWDIYNNHSQVAFEITGAEPVKKFNLPNYSNVQDTHYQLVGNNLVIKSPVNPDNPCAYVYSNRMRYQLETAYQVNQTVVFLWDMDQGLPDSLLYGNMQLGFNYQAIMPGSTLFNYFGEYVELKVPGNALFDTVFLTTEYIIDTSANREKFILCKDVYPIRKNITVTLKPTLDYKDRERTGVYGLDHVGNPSYVGGAWHGNSIEFKTRNWGTYTLLADTVLPEVKPLILNKDQLVFRINDKLSGVDKYELTLDGEWVLMNYDYKKNIIRSEKLDPKRPFNGPLLLKVTDNAGNIKSYSTRL